MKKLQIIELNNRGENIKVAACFVKLRYYCRINCVYLQVMKFLKIIPQHFKDD